MIITLAEYGRIHNCDQGNLRRKAADGAFRTARRLGPIWVIDDKEPYRDRRRKEPKDKDSRPE